MSWLVADWPAPSHVKTALTTRQGGVSKGVFGGLNLGHHVGDKQQDVLQNRQWLQSQFELDAIQWLQQVHGTHVVEASRQAPLLEADACFTTQAHVACAVLTADCLPVLFCDQAGTWVAAAHAGWRGLLNGVLETTIGTAPCAKGEIIAYLGPAIGPTVFEVGGEVREAFLAKQPHAAAAFLATASGKYLADIYQLARLRLAEVGVSRVFGEVNCTVTQPERFFSYRRDQQTGRQASLIWLAP